MSNLEIFFCIAPPRYQESGTSRGLEYLETKRLLFRALATRLALENTVTVISVSANIDLTVVST
jgi:hypothetical protein